MPAGLPTDLNWALVWLAAVISFVALAAAVALLFLWERRVTSPVRRRSALDLKVEQFADAVAVGQMARADRILARIFALQDRDPDPTKEAT